MKSGCWIAGGVRGEGADSRMSAGRGSRARVRERLLLIFACALLAAFLACGLFAVRGMKMANCKKSEGSLISKLFLNVRHVIFRPTAGVQIPRGRKITESGCQNEFLTGSGCRGEIYWIGVSQMHFGSRHNK